MSLNFLSPRLLNISNSFENSVGITIQVIRLDEIHPIISGNKWFKLQGYLRQAAELKCTTLATYGGAYSNHLVAVAKAAQLNHWQSIGYVRSYSPVENATLLHCKNMGMQLHWLHPNEFRNACREIPENKYGGVYYIPEGGYGPLGTAGFSVFTQYIPHNCTHIIASVGTGTMLAGLAKTFPEKTILGINATKGNVAAVFQEINALLTKPATNLEVLDGFHAGGFGKITTELIDFMNAFYTKTNIPLDRVYTAKAMYALQTLVAQQYFPPDANIVFIHSGGLQGNDSLPAGTLVY